MPLSPEEKVLLKKYQNLRKKTDKQYQFRKQRNYTKPTINQLLEFKNDSNYNLYLDSATDKVNGYIESQEEALEQFPQNLVEFEIEDLVREDIDERQKGYSGLSIAEREERGLWPGAYTKFLHRIDPFSKEDQSILKKTWHFKGNLVIARDHYCVLTPDMDFNDIKESECNFGFGFGAFINAFKERSQKVRAQEKWEREFISFRTAKKYFTILKETVDNTDAEEIIKEQEYNSLVNYVSRWRDWLKRPEPDYRSPEYKTHRAQSRFFSRAYRFWDYSLEKMNEKAVEASASASAKETVSGFIAKNTEKVANVLKKRPDCDQIEANLWVGQAIEGNINVTCQNGDAFRVYNQLVYVSEFQDQYRMPFYRFPTTFHDIKHGDHFIKMESERWMNEEFTKL